MMSLAENLRSALHGDDELADAALEVFRKHYARIFNRMASEAAAAGSEAFDHGDNTTGSTKLAELRALRNVLIILKGDLEQ